MRLRIFTLFPSSIPIRRSQCLFIRFNETVKSELDQSLKNTRFYFYNTMHDRKRMILLCIILILISCLISINSQDCGYPGQTCRDDANCCGGCCVSGVCIQDDRSCYFRDDPCATHSCPEEAHCTVYRPDNCPGCQSYPVCTPFSGNGEY